MDLATPSDDENSVVSGNQDEEEVEYNVFFNTNEIKETIQDQEKNLFSDLTEMQRDLIDESAIGKINKFDILDFAPENNEKDGKLKRMKTIILKSSGANTPISSEDSEARQ